MNQTFSSPAGAELDFVLRRTSGGQQKSVPFKGSSSRAQPK